MDIYSNTIETYKHRIYDSGSAVDPDGEDVTYEYTAPDGTVYSGTADKAGVGIYDIEILPSKYNGESTLNVDYAISGNSVTERVGLFFGAPYISINELNQALPDDDFQTRKNKERLVSAIINSYCGQKFGFYHRTLSFHGTGSDSLHVPIRIVTLEKLESEGYDLTPYAKVSDTNWSVTRKTVVNSPFFNDTSLFKYNDMFDITAEWGWPFVPNEIQRAAKILLKDYEENEAKWREKNVDVIRAADWRMEFASKPISTTGNINADVLIGRFTVPRWTVI